MAIQVSSNGVNLKNANTNQTTFSDKYPFHKLDKLNQVSFQTITIQFFNEPPNPNGTTVFTQTTQVYKFAHGYSYIPTIWSLFEVTSFTGSAAATSTSFVSQPDYYNQGYGVIMLTTDTGANAAFLQVQADATNVYVNVIKAYDTVDESPLYPPNIIGTIIKLRVYVFVEDLGV